MSMKEFLDRYGPTVAVLTLLGLLAVLLPGNVKESNVVATGDATATTDDTITSDTIAVEEGSTFDGAAGGTTDTVAGGSAGGTTAGGAPKAAATARTAGGAAAPAGSTQAGGTAAAAPGAVKFGSGPNCREDGRQKAFSYATPPCVEWAAGTSNGGATDKGVTADKILVIRYRGQENAATSAALTGAGASDSRPDTEKQYQNFVKYFNQHFETYGREVVLKVFDASGDTDESQRADAIAIAEKLGAFAVLNAPTVGAEELARRGVVCMCTTSLSRQYYSALPPYIFSSLPTSEGYSTHTAEYLGKRLAGDNAIHSSDPSFKAKPRQFGHIWYEGENGRADPIRKIGRDFYIAELAKYGIKLKAEFSYIFDITKAPDQSQSMIAKMKSEGVTSITLAVDPLYPIFITQEATKQNYFPEWIILGTALTDTTFFGRTYDKAQMRSAFGISPLYVSWADFKSSPGWKEYHHADPSANQNTTDGKIATNVNRSVVNILFSGIQMAGPKLNQDTFAQGLFDLPVTGGGAARPLLKFTRQDPTWYKDFNEIFWDSTYDGKDEVNKDGVGAYLHVDGGKRYQAGQWPESPPKVFTRDGAVFTSDNPAGGPQATPHDADGHKHDPNQRCLSCT